MPKPKRSVIQQDLQHKLEPLFEAHKLAVENLVTDLLQNPGQIPSLAAADPPDEGELIDVESLQVLQRRQQQSLQALSAQPELWQGDLGTTLSELTRLCTQVLPIERAGIWFYRDQEQSLCCQSLCQAAEQVPHEQLAFSAHHCPLFFAALQNEVPLEISGAQTHQQMQELLSSYLMPEQIQALLGTPIYSQHQVQGFLFLESSKADKIWSAQELLFATALCSQISLGLEIQARSAAEQELESKELLLQDVLQSVEELESMVTSSTQELRANEARVRQMLEALPVGVFVLDKAGTPSYANQMAQQMLGQGICPQARYQDLNQIYPIYQAGSDQLYPTEAQPIQRALRGESCEVSDFEVQQPERNIRLAVSASPIHDQEGKLSYAIATFSDITQLKETETELIDARQRAEEANQAKGQFLANMSHEIRTPINAIFGFNHLLLKTEPTNKQHEYIRKSKEAAHNLLGIINDILDFSKIEANMLNIENTSFELEKIIVRSANILGLKAQEKDLEMVLDIPPLPGMLLGDPMRLEQVLINLLNNAIKFTATGTVSLVVTLLAQDTRELRLRFEVQDTGLGMSPEQQQRLFQAFSQADISTTRQFGGTGLGLAISQKLVQLMGGQISVRSAKDQGSTFTFELAFGYQPSSKNTTAQALPANVKSLKILVIDDHQIVLNILRDYLGGFGFQVETQSSSQSALHDIVLSLQTHNPYDLLLVDWKMPGLSGIELLQQCWQMMPEDRPRAILMTAYGSEEALQQVEALELDGFLLKPITPSYLFDTLVKVFDKSAEAVSESLPDECLPVGILPAQRGARILLVEDNLINQQVAQELLSSEGLHVDLASHGQEALTCLHHKDYDLILMDLQMPVLDGYEATRQIRQQARYQQLPIIALTAEAIRGVQEKVLAAGMNDYISKPIQLEPLFQTLTKWLPQQSVNAPPQPAESSDLSSSYWADVFLNGLRQRSDLAIDEALARLAGNQKRYIQLLQQFTRDLPAVCQRIETALTHSDWEQAHYELHSLKGSAANLGFTQIQELMTSLESQLPDQTQVLATWAAGHKAIKAYLQQLNLEAYQVLPAALPQPASQPPDLHTQLKKDLQSALENYDPSAAELVAELCQLEPGQPELRVIQQQIENFDFDTALSLWQKQKNQA